MLDGNVPVSTLFRVFEWALPVHAALLFVEAEEYMVYFVVEFFDFAFELVACSY